MKQITVVVLRCIESAKFGVVIPKGAIRNAWTEDGERFMVEAYSPIRIIVNKKDLRLI